MTQLGINFPGGLLPGDIISAAKFLTQLPDGSVIRNGCEARLPHHAGQGVYFIKVSSSPEEWDWCWALASPGWHSVTPREIGLTVFRAVDIFLPVQLVRHGP